MGDSNTINFYSDKGEYGCFSNFSRHNILLKDKRWQTTEHYFQAQKFAGTPYEEQVRATSSPGKAAQLGRSRALPLRKDWEKVKDGIMKECLVAKFTQHSDIQLILLSTQDKMLVEHTKNDSYWGDGGDSANGKNKLGFLLMEVRDEIRKGLQDPEQAASTLVDTSAIESEDNSKSSSSGDEEVEEGEEGEGEVVGDIEPNSNHMYEPGFSAEKKTNGLKKKVRKSGGSSKSKSKRGVFKDVDGNATLEKSNDHKGSVSVIGEGTVFSEKALPPQAKYVVNKHQMQRKYHPTEEDFPDLEEKEEQDPKDVPRRKVMADFFKLRTTEGETQQIPVAAEETMNAEECLETAKNNLELLKEISEPELKTELLENSRKLRDALRRFIEEFAETGDERLAAAMEQFEQLESVC